MITVNFGLTKILVKSFQHKNKITFKFYIYLNEQKRTLRAALF